MRRSPFLFGLHAKPRLRPVLGSLLFIVLISTYLRASNARLRENENDKFMPSLRQMAEVMYVLSYSPQELQDGETGVVAKAGRIFHGVMSSKFFGDAVASVRRISLGVGGAALVGLLIGLNAGIFPGFRAIMMPFLTTLSYVPPLAVLPILLIVFGVDEFSKVMLIFLGTVLVISCDIFYTTEKIPREQITTALTLGASSLQVAYRVILPQVMPRLLVLLTVCLGSAWLFLISAEMIAASEGLGYRIFLVQRQNKMSIIIPYILCMTFLAFLMTRLMHKVIAWKYPWYNDDKS